MKKPSVRLLKFTFFLSHTTTDFWSSQFTEHFLIAVKVFGYADNTYSNTFGNLNHYIPLRPSFLVHFTSSYEHNYKMQTETKSNSELIKNSGK